MRALTVLQSNRSNLGKLLLLSGAIVLAAGCGGGDSTAPPPGGGKPDVWNVVSQRSWTIGGQTEGYICHAPQVTSDEYITGFRVASPPAAQAEVYLLVRDSPFSSTDFECSFSTLTGSELLYAASYGADSIKFSEGKGVHVAAGQYLLLVIHMNNTADTAVSVATTIEGRAGTAADVTTPVDMVLAGTANIQIQSDGQTHESTGGCVAVASSHIVALLPLMRTFGTHQRIDVITDAATQTLVDAAFDPTHVRFTMLSNDASWPGGSQMKVTCSYVNNSGTTVHFGNSADSESCFNAIYRYPSVAATSTAPFDCVPDIFASVAMPRPEALSELTTRTGQPTSARKS
jgi:hypothetical protein